MTEQKVYRCDFCGDDFRTEEECIEHEKRHLAPLAIVISYGKKVFSPNRILPHTLHVKMSDGTLWEYYVHEEVILVKSDQK